MHIFLDFQYDMGDQSTKGGITGDDGRSIDDGIWWDLWMFITHPNTYIYNIVYIYIHIFAVYTYIHAHMICML